MQYPIAPNHRCFFPRRLIFVDTESNIGKEDEKRYSEHRMRLGVAVFVSLDKNAQIINRDVFEFKTSQEFWGWAMSKTLKAGTLNIYGHNLKYDAINLDVLSALQERDYEIPYPILNHKFIMCCHKIINDKKCYRLKLVDTFNFSQFSLKEIGKRFGLEKLKADFENDTDEKLFAYCHRDAEIVEIFVLSYIRFLVNNDLGSFKDTLAGTSFSVYRHKFLKEIWCHDDREVLALERQAYFGGRSECWFIGKLPSQKYFAYDVKSMYPYVMSEKKLPYKMIGIIQSPSIENVKRLIADGKYLITECIIKTNDMIVPYPIRHLNIDKSSEFSYTSTLLFPRGEYHTYLHLSELEYALEHNHIVSISLVVVYECAVLFRDFINYFYPLKQNSTNNVERELSKLTMNSTYGAFGKRHYETEPIDIPDGIMDDTMTINLKLTDDNLGYAIVKREDRRQTYHNWLGKLYRVTADTLTPVRNTNVALAGAVTAYARMYLFEMLQVCGESHRFYSDTDSIITDLVGSERLKPYIGDNLGNMELQLEFDHGKINCPKDYEFGDKVRLKGISRGALQISENSFQMTHFTSFKDYIRTGKHGTIIIDKTLKREYNKGVVLKSGFVESPIMKLIDGVNIRVK